MECVQQLRKELIPNCGQLSAKTNNTPSLSQLKDVADPQDEENISHLIDSEDEEPPLRLICSNIDCKNL